MKLGEGGDGDWSYGEYAFTCKKNVIPGISSRQTKCTRKMSKKAFTELKLNGFFF